MPIHIRTRKTNIGNPAAWRWLLLTVVFLCLAAAAQAPRLTGIEIAGNGNVTVHGTGVPGTRYDLHWTNALGAPPPWNAAVGFGFAKEDGTFDIANKSLHAPSFYCVREHPAHGSVQLWEDGPYWAETNIGAEKPEEYGLYFWWGDTVGYRHENDAWIASNGSSSKFSFGEGAPTYGKDVATLQGAGWLTAEGVLAPEHDAAQVHWGGGWRVATARELDDLAGKCDWTWTTTNGVNGYVVRGRGDFTDASIFLPAAGSGFGVSLHDDGAYGYYWSSVPTSINYSSEILAFDYAGYHAMYFDDRTYGLTIRPVRDSAE